MVLTEAHRGQVRHEPHLPALPSPSFADIELLLVVRRSDRSLFEYLQRRLVGVRGVEVTLERRKGDRRQATRAHADDRRRLQRRIRHGQMSSLGYTMVRLGRR